jgi:hypothetical protein
MASVTGLNQSAPPTSVIGSGEIDLVESYTHHKITVRGSSAINIKFMPHGQEDYDEWSDESEGLIAQNSSDVFLTGPAKKMSVTTAVPGETVQVKVLSW